MTSPLDPDWTPTADLRAEIERLTEQLKLAVWSDSEECKFLTKENERLRAALARIEAIIDSPASYNSDIQAVVDAALADQRKG